MFFSIGVPNEIRTRVTAVKGRCPRPLDDGDKVLQNYSLGGDKRSRTADLLHAMQALYQLSHTPESRRARIVLMRLRLVKYFLKFLKKTSGTRSQMFFHTL